MVSEKIKLLIDQSLGDLDLAVSEIELEHPGNEAHGDYSSNVAMVLFARSQTQNSKFETNQNEKIQISKQYKNPRELAQAVVDQILNRVEGDTLDWLEKVDVAGPGFVNFYLSESYFLNELHSVLSAQDEYGKSDHLAKQTISVEYTDPNPFKEFHIGHLYSNTVGESICRLLEACGAKVWRADYFGDVGMHVAKSIWGLLKKLDEDGFSLNDLESWELPERIKYLGEAYALGATAYKENEQAQDEMKDLNYLIYAAVQEYHQNERGWEPVVDYQQFIGEESVFDYEQIKTLYITGRQWSLDYFETVYDRVGMSFDGYYPESLVGEIGYQLVMNYLEKGVFEKGEGGAIIFPGEKYELHNRVFINALGLPTYEAKELGLAPKKYEDVEYDRSIIITGNEINEYFQVLIEALKQVHPKLGSVTKHIGHGMVRLPEGKMSSRTGKIIRGLWLLDEAKKRIFSILEESPNEIENKDTVAEEVGQASVKYTFLKQNIGEDIAFDFDTSLSFEGNSGPYLQYTHARAGSVLEKAGGSDSLVTDWDSHAWHESRAFFDLADGQNDFNFEEVALMRWLPRFSEAIVQATEEYAPHMMCNYLYQLAQRFNSFYNKHSILQAESYEKRQLRLALTAAIAQILKNGLLLLGIKAPEKM